MLIFSNVLRNVKYPAFTPTAPFLLSPNLTESHYRFSHRYISPRGHAASRRINTDHRSSSRIQAACEKSAVNGS
jgi:hypothetical protein